MQTRKIIPALFSIAIFICAAFVQQQTEIGVQLYSFRNQFPKDVEGTLKKSGPWALPNWKGGDTYGLPVNTFKKMLDDNGFKTISVGAGYEALKKRPFPLLFKMQNRLAQSMWCVSGYRMMIKALLLKMHKQ